MLKCNTLRYLHTTLLALALVSCGDSLLSDDDNNSTQEDTPTAYITQVIDYMPAPGQYTNSLPEYEEGDTQEDMNRKVLEYIGNNNGGLISLGGYGGYVTVGFDHTIENREGLCDFRVTGNAYYSTSNPDPDAPEGGSCEAGIIMVAYDANNNGLPDSDEWYEIAGSSHADVTQEPWYDRALGSGNDMSFYSDFTLSYTRPTSEPEQSDFSTYIAWSDNKGNSGYVEKNIYHSQSYYPQWVEFDILTFSGSRLPQNGVYEDSSSYYVLYKFLYGYADNHPNSDQGTAIDIAWAVDSNGNSAQLPGVDFIKIYTGVNQANGGLGESSTEIAGIEDLHILEVEVVSNY
ncbi:MAG: PKD domain-containing protein [Rikenellaceae bacterium]